MVGMQLGSALRRPVADVLLFRLVFLAVGWSVHTTLRRAPRELRWDLDLWTHWDAANLLRIAEVGYSEGVASGDSAAYFPGFPLVVRAVRAVGLGTVTAGLLVTTVATCIAAYYLARLAEHDGHSGERAVVALLLFPTAVYLVAPYTEAMFLAAALPAFWFAKTGRPWAAVPCVFVASATRSVGIFVAVGVVVELLRRREAGSSRRVVPTAAVAVAGVAPVLLFGLHLHRTRGDFFEFLHAQERGWGRSATDPLTSLANSVRSLSADQTPDFLLAYRLELAFALASVILLFWLVDRREWGYAAFVGGTLAVAMTSVVYVSIPRFALTFFPFAFVISDLSGTDRRFVRVAAVMGAVSMLGVVAFVNGRWYS